MPPAIDPRLRDVGRRVRDHRLEAGYSLSGLASAAGVGKSTLSELEQGQRNPTLETLYALAGVLGVPLAGFVAGGAAMPGRHGGIGTPGAQSAKNGVAVGGGPVSARFLEARRIGDGSLVEVYWLAIGPGRRVSPGHGPGVSERLVLVSGRAVVGPVDSPVDVVAGGVVAWESTGQHLYSSEHGAEGVLTIINPARRGGVGT
ncbi:helix-turn-helix domain-containing protein [Arthrobacter sp.]|uniref:helix-turn-helix domain-containing protein n=1 Tax=Arthrobacter sp. TaxID=1667 RepID=UPI003A93E1D7